MSRFLGTALLLAACASAPQNPFRPSVRLEQLGPMSFGATTAPLIPIEVQVTNTANEPLTIRTVRIEGGLSQQYAVTPAERVVTEVVAPGATRGVRLTVTAVSRQGRISDPEPLTLRGFVTYTVAGRQYQDLYIFPSIVQ